MEENKKKIDKNFIPQDFTYALAFTDALPVIFFGIFTVMLGIKTGNVLFIIGSAISFLAGLLKVIWKIIAVSHKNIWILFIQMRYLMPFGFLLMLAGFIWYACGSDMNAFFQSFANPLSVTLLVIGVIGIVAMVVFCIKLDPKNKKSNVIEQGTNAVAQAAFFLAVLFSVI